MNKFMMNKMLNKLCYQYYCDVYFEKQYIILDSKRYNFTLYINAKQITNNVHKRLFSIQNISYVYEKIIRILDTIVNHLNFDEKESVNLVATPIIKYFIPELIITPKNKLQLDTEIFSVVFNSPSVYYLNSINRLENIAKYIVNLTKELNDLTKYAKGEISKCNL